MLEYWKDEDYIIEKKKVMPVSIRAFDKIDCVEELMKEKNFIFSPKKLWKNRLLCDIVQIVPIERR